MSEIFTKKGDRLKVEEQVFSEMEFTMGEIDNKILELETELTKWKKLRREGEKLGLRELFNIPKVDSSVELQDIKTE